MPDRIAEACVHVWGRHIYRLEPLNQAAQRQLLGKTEQHRGWALTPRFSTYLYQRAPRDLYQPGGLIRRLDELSLEQKRPITCPYCVPHWSNTFFYPAVTTD